MIDFSSFIEDRTCYFTGREWVFARINAWLSEKSGPRTFLLIGRPGTGKSAILARLAQFNLGQAAVADCPCLSSGFLAYYHFCQATWDASLSPLRFVEALSLALARYQPFAKALIEPKQGNPQITINATQNVTIAANGSKVQNVVIENLNLGNLSAREAFDLTVRRPLEALCTSDFEETVVILVDSLDEARTWNGESNILTLLTETLDDPRDLPYQIRFIFSCRPDEIVLKCRPGENVLGLVPSLDLVADAPPNAQEVCQYALTRLKKASLASRLSYKIADRLARASEGNFLYPRYVLDAWLEHPKDITLESTLYIPAGLGGIYLGFLTRELKHVDEKWEDRYQPLLGLLAVARGEGLTATTLAGASGKKRSQVDNALHACMQYLSGPMDEGPFRIYHQSFRDFLLEKENYVNPKEAHQALADYYLSKFKAGGWVEADPYSLCHLSYHLIQIKNWDGIKILLENGFFSQKAKLLGLPDTITEVREIAVSLVNSDAANDILLDCALVYTRMVNQLRTGDAQSIQGYIDRGQLDEVQKLIDVEQNPRRKSILITAAASKLHEKFPAASEEKKEEAAALVNDTVFPFEEQALLLALFQQLEIPLPDWATDKKGKNVEKNDQALRPDQVLIPSINIFEKDLPVVETQAIYPRKILWLWNIRCIITNWVYLTGIIIFFLFLIFCVTIILDFLIHLGIWIVTVILVVISLFSTYFILKINQFFVQNIDRYIIGQYKSTVNRVSWLAKTSKINLVNTSEIYPEIVRIYKYYLDHHDMIDSLWPEESHQLVVCIAWILQEVLVENSSQISKTKMVKKMLFEGAEECVQGVVVRWMQTLSKNDLEAFLKKSFSSSTVDGYTLLKLFISSSHYSINPKLITYMLKKINGAHVLQVTKFLVNLPPILLTSSILTCIELPEGSLMTINGINNWSDPGIPVSTSDPMQFQNLQIKYVNPLLLNIVFPLFYRENPFQLRQIHQYKTPEEIFDAIQNRLKEECGVFDILYSQFRSIEWITDSLIAFALIDPLGLYDLQTFPQLKIDRVLRRLTKKKWFMPSKKAIFSLIEDQACIELISYANLKNCGLIAVSTKTDPQWEPIKQFKRVLPIKNPWASFGLSVLLNLLLVFLIGLWIMMFSYPHLPVCFWDISSITVPAFVVFLSCFPYLPSKIEGVRLLSYLLLFVSCLSYPFADRQTFEFYSALGNLDLGRLWLALYPLVTVLVVFMIVPTLIGHWRGANLLFPTRTELWVNRLVWVMLSLGVCCGIAFLLNLWLVSAPVAALIGNLCP